MKSERELLLQINVKLNALLHLTIQGFQIMSQATDNIVAAMQAELTMDDKVIALLGNLKTELDAAIAKASSDGNLQPVIDLANELTVKQAAVAAAMGVFATATPPAAPSPADAPAPAAPAADSSATPTDGSAAPTT